MQFNLPTTKDQMYQILNDIFYYYRIRKPNYEELMLKSLDLDKMTYTPLTDVELTNKALTMIAAEHEREIFMRKVELTAKIEQLNSQIDTAEQESSKNIEKVNLLYEQSITKLGETSLNNEFINSSIYLDKLAYLENEKNKQISEINNNLSNKLESYNALIAEYTNELESVSTYYDSVHEKELELKVLELKDEQEKLKKEVFKYNNALEEKLQRYDNDILKTNSSLKIKYMEVNAGEYTKDQLIDMGYYEDAIRCVCGYYDTLSSATAYQSITSDRKVAVYLDDYYQNVVYMYGIRSGMIG